MITTYVRLLQSDKHLDCVNCGQKIVPGDWVYWHGRTLVQMNGTNSMIANTHKGCFWDSKNGPAPHLTWAQITAINNAVIGQRFPEDDETVRRFLGAVTVHLARREGLPDKDSDAGLRMGPDLLDGYRRVLKAMQRQHDPFWRPVEANGRTLWQNPDKAQAEPTRAWMTGDELAETRNQRIHDSMERMKKNGMAVKMTPEQLALMEQVATDGWLVKGIRVTPILVGSTCGMQLWIRDRAPGSEWYLSPPNRVYSDEQEARAEALSWANRRRA